MVIGYCDVANEVELLCRIIVVDIRRRAVDIARELVSTVLYAPEPMQTNKKLT